MEKRFALFLILSALILFTHLTVQNFLHPPQADQPPAEVAEGGDGQAKPKPEPAKKAPDAGAAKLEKQPAEAAAKQPAEAPGPALVKGEPTAAVAPPPVEVPKKWVTLGFDGSRQPVPADGHAEEHRCGRRTNRDGPADRQGPVSLSGSGTGQRVFGLLGPRGHR